jgi:hypothetical protein
MKQAYSRVRVLVILGVILAFILADHLNSSASAFSL